LVWAGPDPDIRARPEKKNGGGELFFPSHPPACRTIFDLHAREGYSFWMQEKLKTKMK
jgi:hypothetical protein